MQENDMKSIDGNQGILYANHASPALAFPPTHPLTNVAIAFLANHPDRIMRVVKNGWISRITVLIVCQRMMRRKSLAHLSGQTQPTSHRGHCELSIRDPVYRRQAFRRYRSRNCCCQSTDGSTKTEEHFQSEGRVNWTLAARRRVGKEGKALSKRSKTGSKRSSKGCET
jgi:hypothetical protein